MREQASFLTTAVVGSADNKPAIPDHKLMLTPFAELKEAHFVCACLANSVAQFIAKSYVVETQTSTHILSYITVPKFNPKDKVHQELASLSEQAHQAAAEGDKETVASIERRIDELAAELWGLTKAELKEIQESLAELR